MKLRFPRSRLSVALGASGVIALVGAWLLLELRDSDSENSGELLTSRLSVDVEVEVASPTAGKVMFSGEFVVDPSSLRSSGSLDMSGIPNDSGIFGDYESIDTAWDGYVGLFDVTTPEGEWLLLDLESASPARGADIEWLRPAMLCNPGLAIDLMGAEAVSGQIDLGSLRREGFPGTDVASSVFHDAWSMEEATVKEGNQPSVFTIRFSYPVVLASSDNVEVTCRYRLTASEEEPQLPDDSEIVTYDELTS